MHSEDHVDGSSEGIRLDSGSLTDEEFKRELFYTNKSQSVDDVDFTFDKGEMEDLLDSILP